MEAWYDRAKARMRELGITQEALKQVLGVSTRGAVGHYLTGRRQPTPAQMEALSRTLHISTDWLLTGRRAGHEIAKEPTPYRRSKKPSVLSPEEGALLERYRDLSAEDRARLHEIIAALSAAAIKAGRKRD